MTKVIPFSPRSTCRLLDEALQAAIAALDDGPHDSMDVDESIAWHSIRPKLDGLTSDRRLADTVAYALCGEAMRRAFQNPEGPF